ncbi:MAG: bifunctional riboflavin kinase/FAD synthetase [Clostridia bacterium]|nr:bifunctional riboflavin kinase/FAD synthetase [Clostridia bacterium]
MTKTVLALGMFDGMHIGHKKLIDTAVLLAAKYGHEPAVFTFANHPQKLFGAKVARLCSNEERLAIMQKLGAKRIEQVEFTRELSSLSPEKFMDMLIEKMQPHTLVAGFNYTFGKNKSGNTDLLTKLAIKNGIGAAVIPPVNFANKPVSSTRIRELIEKGDVQNAQLMLGRTYALSGTVMQNKRIGSTIGFPTANILPDETRAIPQDGVYISMARLAGDMLPSVTNIGTNPTVGGRSRMIETHIFDFNRDIYGEAIEVFFVKRLRGVKAFSSLDELKAQIASDCKTAKEYFGCN